MWTGGNIFAGADWCSKRITRIFQRDPDAMLGEGEEAIAGALSPGRVGRCV
jgi:hypothetical protein